MASVKDKKRGLKSENLGQLQNFIEKVKKGDVSPFADKTEKARQDLKNAGLIK
jgi:hypothetical protein